MAFLFGKKKQQQQYGATSGQSKDGATPSPALGPPSSLPTPNGVPAGARDREKELGPDQSPTTAGSLSNSINSLQNGTGSSPEQKGMLREKDLDFQVSRSALIYSVPFPESAFLGWRATRSFPIQSIWCLPWVSAVR
jgi:hypothetical protein